MDIFIRDRKYTGQVKAVILDWAGTAVDYGSLAPLKVFCRVFESHGVEVELDEVRPFMGLMKKDHLREMLNLTAVAAKWFQAHGENPSQKTVETLYADIEPMLVEIVGEFSDPIPGLLDSMEELRGRGVLFGSSTGYTGPMMAALKPAAAQKGYAPESVVCATDVSLGRPYPYMCFQNAINLETYPMEAMVKVGDTLTDIHEGLNAGMWCVGVTQTGNELGLSREQAESFPPVELKQRLAAIAERFSLAGAHYVIRGIWELPVVVEDINCRLAKGELPPLLTE